MFSSAIPSGIPQWRTSLKNLNEEPHWRTSLRNPVSHLTITVNKLADSIIFQLNRGLTLRTANLLISERRNETKKTQACYCVSEIWNVITLNTLIWSTSWGHLSVGRRWIRCTERWSIWLEARTLKTPRKNYSKLLKTTNQSQWSDFIH